MVEDLCAILNTFSFTLGSHLSDSNKERIDKLFYYAIMTKIYIIKSSSDIDNKEPFLLSISSSFKVWISSDSDTEEEYNIDTDDPKSID